MIKLPNVSKIPDVPKRKMSLREYALFSEKCLKSNPTVNPENCLEKRALEKSIKKPFSMKKS